jgi:hypothetical protein
MRIAILAAVDINDVTAARRGLLTSLHPFDVADCWDRFSDLLRHLPVELVITNPAELAQQGLLAMSDDEP